MPIQTEAPSRKSWRDVLLISPAAELFPRMSPDELRALGEDILKNGLTSPIVLWRADDKASAVLLDGRDRLDAIEIITGYRAEVGVEDAQWVIDAGSWVSDKVIVLDESVDPFAYVISANIHRRHLTTEQRRELIAKLLKAMPEKSDRHIAKTVKASPTTVGTVRAEMEAKGDVSKLDTRTDATGRKQPATKPQRAAANAAPSHDDIGPASTDEAERLRVRNEELEAENARLRGENTALRSEVEELRAQLAPGDAGPMPHCLRREAAP